MSRSRVLVWSLLGLAATVLFIVVATAPPRVEDRALSIGSQIRCPVCQGESIADSPSETARAMMALIRNRLDEGASEEAIIDELLGSYGGSLLLDPPARGATLWLWLAPVAALGLGGTMIVRRFRAQATAAVPANPTTVDRRWLLGGAILVVGAAIATATVGHYQQARPEDFTLSGVAGGSFDPDSVSNETLEAVVAANSDHPDINGMRLALANRYFEEGLYQEAFPHYQTVLDNDPAPSEAANAFTRLGWMVFDGNDEADLGLELIERGLEIVPGDAFAIYLKGRIVWCGQADPAGAAEIFRTVLSTPDLDDEVRATVEAELAAAEAGGSCP